MSLANESDSNIEPGLNDAFWKALNTFSSHIADLLRLRWDAWALSNAENEVHEVVGALLARQVTLVSQLAQSPSVWNDHVAPLLLRPLIEAAITAAWILLDAPARASSFVKYGLGQEKLLLEHEKAKLKEAGIDPDSDERIQFWEKWLNGERYMDLTEVNVGDWAGVSLREMAIEADCLDLHREDYTRWSAATHNMWHHIVKFNLGYCQNPLHGYHRLPTVLEIPTNPTYLQWAAEYLDQSFDLFDKLTGISVGQSDAMKVLNEELMKIPFTASKETTAEE